MATESSTAPQSLRLTWPTFIHYHSDLVDPTTEGANSVAPRDPDQSSPSSPQCEKYNDGIPLELLGEAQSLGDDEFRLLDLHPGKPGTLLIGDLRKVSLSGHDEYEPLSYTWADHPTDVTKGDNDINPYLHFKKKNEIVGSIRLQTNCARALYRIRNEDLPKKFWVDAICINQKDTEERSRQLSLMQRIYARAHTVIAYVGHKSEEHHSDTAMWLLNNLEILDSGRLNAFQLSSINHFVRRPYFQRMWIVQECALAVSLKLICGTDPEDEVYISKFAKISLEKLVAANRGAIPAWLKHSRQMTEVVRQEGSAQAKQLLDLIFDTGSCKCSDARDRIFALFNLLGTESEDNAGSDQRLVADYSLTVEQVYSGIAAFFVDNGFLGTILKLAALTRRRRETSSSVVRCLPSWVPDWSRITIDMRHTLRSQVKDNNIGDVYFRNRYVFELHLSTLDSDQVSEGAAKDLTGPSTRLDLGIGYPKLWNSGAVTFQGLMLGEVNHGDRLLRPGTLKSKQSAVCIPARDFSHTVSLREECTSSGDHVLTLSELHRSYNGFYHRFWRRLTREGKYDSRRTQRSSKYVIESFRPSDPLSDSERLQYDQMLPHHLEQLKRWPNFWTQPLEARVPAPRLRSSIVEDICRVRAETFSRLQPLWQKWQEQAPRGRWILEDQDQIKLVLDEMERVGSLSKIWQPTWPSLRTGLRPGDVHYDGNDYGDLAFASFLALFIKDPDVLKEDSQTDKPQQPLLETKAPAIENTTVEESPMQHLMDWAWTTFALFAEIEHANVDEDLEIWTALPQETMKLWYIACNTIRYQFRVVKVVCQSKQPHAVSLLKKIKHELPQVRKPGLSPSGRRRIRSEEYWNWTRFTCVFSPKLLEWASAEADRDKVRLLRHSMDDVTWGVFKSKLERIDVFGKVGVNLVEPEFATFKIV